MRKELLNWRSWESLGDPEGLHVGLNWKEWLFSVKRGIALRRRNSLNALNSKCPLKICET